MDIASAIGEIRGGWLQPAAFCNDSLEPIAATPRFPTFATPVDFTKTTTGTRAPSAGFTLLELLLAVMIVAVLAAIALAGYEQYRERTDILQAVADVGMMSIVISQYTEDNRLPADTLDDVGFGGKLDPWGRPYQYRNLMTADGKGGARKDKKLNPLNSDFDLYSVGKDGESVPPLPAAVSQDDIVRARDGRFIGLARDFDP